MKHSSRDTILTKFQNGEIVKLLYSPLSAISLEDPYHNGYQSQFLTPLAATYIVSASVISGRFFFDHLNAPQSPPMTFGDVSHSLFRSINFPFTFLPQPPTPRGLFPFIKFLILSISHFSCTENISYSLCATVTYI